MIVSSPLFEAYLECDTKCWLRARAEPSAGNTYAEWARLKNEESNRRALAWIEQILHPCSLGQRQRWPGQ